MRLAAEKAEQERIEMERERQRLIQEEKERVERERMEAEEKAKRDIAEQNIRIKELKETRDLFNSFKQKMYGLKLEKRANEEWAQYMKCDGLPNPASLGEMNTYLYLWRSTEEQGVLTEVVKRTQEVLDLFKVLEELIDVPLNSSKQLLENWKQVRNDFRLELQKTLNRCTYLILRKMEDTMDSKDTIQLRYTKTFDHFILCLWTVTSLPQSEDPMPDVESKVPLEGDFPEVGITVKLPDSLFDVPLAIRALLVRYDHLSDLCPLYYPNELPEQETKDMYETCLVEWDVKYEFQKIVDAENERRAQIAARVAAMRPVSSQEDARRGKKDRDKLAAQAAAIEAEMLELQKLQDIPIKPASEMFAEKEDKIQSEVKAQLQVNLRPHELNLRKYMILGGIYYIDLVQQPPQPLILHDLIHMPTELQPIDFHEKYVPPPPPEPGQRRLPEEIEAELKKQEEELEKLALASI
ncbi:hypothetical protein L9F63_009568, partial [Diploptera punctata]